MECHNGWFEHKGPMAENAGEGVLLFRLFRPVTSFPPSMLDANRYASPAEAELLRDHIAHDEAASAALQPRVARARTAVHETALALQAAQEAAASAQAILQQLTDMEQTLDAQLAVARGLLHPLRRLPDDVLAIIFSHCRGRDGPDRPVNIWIARWAPFVLAATCRRWRSVASGDPTLWQTIVLDLHLVTGQASELRWSRYLAVVSERSAGLPIHMHIACKAVRTSYEHGLWPVIRALVPRTYVLSVVSDVDINAEVNILLSRSSNHLTSVHIGYYDVEGSFGLQFFSRAPKLRRISVVGLELLWPPESTIFPLVEGLTFGTRQQLNFQDLLDMFYRFPKLDSLEIRLEDLTAATPVSAVCETLTYLNLVAYSCDIQVATSLVFPHLRTAFVNIETVAPDTAVALMRTALRTAHTLHLWFTVGGHLATGLQACAELRHLSLIGRYDETAERFFDALASPTASGAWICPRLETVYISNELSRDSVVDAVLRFASARRSGDAAATPALFPLLEINVVYGSRLQGDARRRDTLVKKLQDLLPQTSSR